MWLKKKFFLVFICIAPLQAAHEKYPPDRETIAEIRDVSEFNSKTLKELSKTTPLGQPAFLYFDDTYKLSEKTEDTCDFYAESYRQKNNNEKVESVKVIHYEPYWLNPDPTYIPVLPSSTTTYASRWMRRFLSDQNNLKKIGKKLPHGTQVTLNDIPFKMTYSSNNATTIDTAVFKPQKKCVDHRAEITSIQVDRQRIGECTKFDVDVKKIILNQPNNRVVNGIIAPESIQTNWKHLAAGLAVGGLVFYTWKWLGRKQ